MLNKMRLLTPGPTPLPEKVRLALAQDMQHHRKTGFKKLMQDMQPKLAALFGTTQPVLPLTSSGTGAMVAAVCSLFAPGERVLVVNAGKFSERWIEICKTHGIEAAELMVEWGKGVEVEAVKAALDADKTLRGVLVQLCETSTGVEHPVKKLAELTRKRDVLLVVDGISGVGICPCPMDEWGLDCLLTGSQKGLMLPPGLALIALSERGWKKAETLPQRNFYFNLIDEKANIFKGQTNFTPAIGLLTGLSVAMDMFMECGLEEIFRKQWALCCMARTGVVAAGLELFAAGAPSWGVTSVKVPAGIDADKLLAHAESHYGVVMAAGQDHLHDSMVRLAHMGWVDWSDLAAGIHALVASYRYCGGHVGTRDYLEQALAAYEQALIDGYPKN